MKHFSKAIIIIAALALFAYLLLIDYPSYREQLAPTQTTVSQATVQTQTEENSGEEETDQSEAVDQAETDATATQTELAAQLEQLYAQYPASNVALCFDQMDELIYEQLAPLLAEYGWTGTVVFRDGDLPGDYGKMTTVQCQELRNAGWEFAIGSDSEIDMTAATDDVVQQLDDYLESYLERIRVRVAVTPTTFIFAEGEYQSAFDEVLEAHGISRILYVPDGTTEITESDTIEKIPYVSPASTSTAEDVTLSVACYQNAAICTQVADDGASYSMTDYETLLQSVSEEQLVEIVSLSQLTDEGTDDVEARAAWLSQIAQLQALMGE